MKDIVNKAAKDPPEKIIPWMTDDLRTSLKNKRETDEEFRKPFAWNRRNRQRGLRLILGTVRGQYRLQYGPRDWYENRNYIT